MEYCGIARRVPAHRVVIPAQEPSHNLFAQVRMRRLEKSAQVPVLFEVRGKVREITLHCRIAEVEYGLGADQHVVSWVQNAFAEIPFVHSTRADRLPLK